MPEFGEQVGDTPVGSKHESVTLDDGRTIKLGDVVGFDAPDLNPYRDSREEPVIVSEVCTGTVSDIYNHDGDAEVSITNDNYGRIDAKDLQAPGDRFDRFRSEIPEGEGCIIEQWWGAFSDEAAEEDFDEYTIEVNDE